MVNEKAAMSFDLISFFTNYPFDLIVDIMTVLYGGRLLVLVLVVTWAGFHIS